MGFSMGLKCRILKAKVWRILIYEEKKQEFERNKFVMLALKTVKK